MNFNQTQRFVIGALAHGMPFEDAFALMTQAQQQRQQRRTAKKSALSNLIEQGVEWSMEEGADPNLVATAVAAQGAAQGLKRPQLKQALSTLGVGESTGVIDAMGQEAVDPEVLGTMSENFTAEYEPMIENMLKEGKKLSDIRQSLAPQAQMEADAAGIPWQSVQSNWNKMVDAAVYKRMAPQGQQEFLLRKQAGAAGLPLTQFLRKQGITPPTAAPEEPESGFEKIMGRALSNVAGAVPQIAPLKALGSALSATEREPEPIGLSGLVPDAVRHPSVRRYGF